MISGRSGGSGKYSYRETHLQKDSVLVAHMPEDSFDVRIIFRNQGETVIPILKLSENQAMLLWASLKLVAADLKWDDRMLLEKLEEDGA